MVDCLQLFTFGISEVDTKVSVSSKEIAAFLIS